MNGARCLLSIVVLSAAAVALAQPLGTAFTYQGELQDGGLPASGPHDLRFRLFDAAAGGAQVGPTLCSDNVPLADGRFTVSLDFGAQFAGQQRFLEVEVRPDTGLNCGSGAGFVILSPRQALTVSPHAAFSLTAATATTATTATDAAQLNGRGPAYYLNAGNLSSGTVPDGRLGGVYSAPLTFSNAGNTITGTHVGSGSGLTGLNASSIASGTLADGRLSSNVALRNAVNAFTAVNTFADAVGIGTTTPVWRLHVVGGVHDGIKVAVPDGTNTSAQVVFSAGLEPQFGQGAIVQLNAPSNVIEPNALLLVNRTPGPLVLGTNNLHRLDITASGDVGVGTTTPAARLHAVASGQYALFGQTASTDGSAVRGEAAAATGLAYGVSGRSDSTLGRGVVGHATAASGTALGVYGRSDSTGGAGVSGFASAATGATYGGRFESASADGTGVWGLASGVNGLGVYGLASAASGTTYGVWGRSLSPGGIGVYGDSTSGAGTTYGVFGHSGSTSGLGVYGEAVAAAGPTYGVWGRSLSMEGTGVFGDATATTGTTHGGHFVSRSDLGVGVYGETTSTAGATIGVWGRSASTSGLGVYGVAEAASGETYGVWGRNHSTGGTAIFGEATATTGTTYAGRFENRSDAGVGLYGEVTSTAGPTRGVWGRSASTTGSGVFGWAEATSGGTRGVSGRTDSTGGTGVFGEATATTGPNYGGRFESASTGGTGVFGLATAATGNTAAVSGRSQSTDGIGGRFDSYGTSGRGVQGIAWATGGPAIGGFFLTKSTVGTGVLAQADSIAGQTLAVNAVAKSPDGIGLLAWNTATAGSAYAVRGVSESNTCRATVGYSPATSGQTAGVLGQANSAQGSGVVGIAASTDPEAANAGVFGQNSNSSPLAYAVYASGKLAATGTKSFVIDHPLDPEHRLLVHYCAEGPAPQNVYNGVVTLDASGGAEVELPAYFASVNKDPRYTLTAVGAPMPLLHVAEKISGESLRAGERAEPGEPPPACSFRIAGGVPGGEVSWEVKADRNDRWVRAHGAPAEVEKPPLERGRYRQPELFGRPAEEASFYHAPERATRGSREPHGLPPERGTDHHAGAEPPRPPEHNE